MPFQSNDSLRSDRLPLLCEPQEVLQIRQTETQPVAVSIEKVPGKPQRDYLFQGVKS